MRCVGRWASKTLPWRPPPPPGRRPVSRHSSARAPATSRRYSPCRRPTHPLSQYAVGVGRPREACPANRVLILNASPSNWWSLTGGVRPCGCQQVRRPGAAAAAHGSTGGRYPGHANHGRQCRRLYARRQPGANAEFVRRSAWLKPRLSASLSANVYWATPSVLFYSTPCSDRRATHNAGERARRGSLNNRFQEIADLIPKLQGEKRPSKRCVAPSAHAWREETTLRRRPIDVRWAPTIVQHGHATHARVPAVVAPTV